MLFMTESNRTRMSDAVNCWELSVPCHTTFNKLLRNKSFMQMNTFELCVGHNHTAVEIELNVTLVTTYFSLMYI